MNDTVTNENLTSLKALYQDSGLPLKWEPLFVTPVFMETWWGVFGGDSQLNCLSVRSGGNIIGIAPFMRRGAEVTFVGNPDVCDYFDCITVPGRENEFYGLLLDHLKKEGVTRLEMPSLRPDSTVLNFFADTAVSRGCEVSFTPNDVSSEMPLPPTWDEYLEYLNTKQRHEVRRKLRRLEEAGTVRYYSVSTPVEVEERYDTFLRMFTESRDDKAEFLTGQRETFFRSLGHNLSEAGMFRLGVLELNAAPAAMIMYFDYHNRIYLYNSGFEKEYDSLSIGLLSKVLSIRESIESGREAYDFLKGDEIYKSRLGGENVRLTDCTITVR